jgi:hypothetical protein
MFSLSHLLCRGNTFTVLNPSFKVSLVKAADSTYMKSVQYFLLLYANGK